MCTCVKRHDVLEAYGIAETLNCKYLEIKVYLPILYYVYYIAGVRVIFSLHPIFNFLSSTASFVYLMKRCTFHLVNAL